MWLAPAFSYFGSLVGMIGAAMVAMAFIALRTMVLPEFVAAFVLSPAAFANASAVRLAAFAP
jgi:hypothetical protein